MGIRNRLANRLQVDGFFPANVFTQLPVAGSQRYQELFEDACDFSSEEIREAEARLGFAIDPNWLNQLALHTQVVIKKSSLNWMHGRLLYAVLRNYLADYPDRSTPITILETGTARGFSAVVMARAVIEAGVCASVVTIDSLPHDTPQYWNCIDDFEGAKTRRELLSGWPSELERIIFIQGWATHQLPRLGFSRIHFAFLDAQHTKEAVLSEFLYVSSRQEQGDVIVFDDVTEGAFDGVVDAVKEVQQRGAYAVERVTSGEGRGYAVARRRSA